MIGAATVCWVSRVRLAVGHTKYGRRVIGHVEHLPLLPAPVPTAWSGPHITQPLLKLFYFPGELVLADGLVVILVPVLGAQFFELVLETVNYVTLLFKLFSKSKNDNGYLISIYQGQGLDTPPSQHSTQGLSRPLDSWGANNRNV